VVREALQNNSSIKELYGLGPAALLRSYCIRRSSCVSFLSLNSSALRHSSAFEELVLQSGVAIRRGWRVSTIADFKREFWGKGGDHVVKLGTFDGDVPHVKLGLHLGEPQLQVRQPKGCDLNSYS